jgi:hypothetical protein
MRAFPGRRTAVFDGRLRPSLSTAKKRRNGSGPTASEEAVIAAVGKETAKTREPTERQRVIERHSERQRDIRCASLKLVRFLAGFLAIALARESFLDATLFARLQIKGVTLDFLDDVLLLNLALEAA